MSEENEEFEEISAEELFEQHKAELEARFEERGFFRRLGDMFSGLSKPRGSREYKLARIEMQRLMAPLLAILLPVVGIIALIVITAVQGQGKDTVVVEVATAQEQDDELKEEKEEEPPEPPEEPPEEVDVTVDTPVPGPVSDFPTDAPPAPPDTPLSVKPAQQDTVAIIKSPVRMRSMTGSRTPGSIGRMTRGGAGYGDQYTEAAVLKALRWLKKTQQTDGSWPRGKANPVSNTALATLAYLAHGETPASAEFGSTVERAIQYLIDQQSVDKNGVCHFKGVDGNEYAYLIATYALGEAYGMTKNPNAKEAALTAMKRIVENQSPTGGWQYKMDKTSTRDDVSYAGWALQALKACKMAGLHPDGLDECIKKAIKCLQTRNFKDGGFNYVAGGRATGLTATGCLAMQLLGYGNKSEVASALDFMREWLPEFGKGNGGAKAGGPLPGNCPQYYCYYAAQCKYQAGMKEGAAPADVETWKKWNAAMKKLYPPSIQDGGEIEGPDGKMHKCGFWTNEDAHVSDKTMATCLCALQLMVYYRYLPTTQTKAGKADDEAEPVSTKSSKKDAAVSVEVDI